MVMEVSLEWLEDFVDLPATDELRLILERGGVEVEAVNDPRNRSTGVVVGEVLTCDKHPKADKLSVCQVSDGSQQFTVVCGADNVATGLRVAFAPPGAEFVTDEGAFRISKRRLRGVESCGMLASREEMGLEEKSDGIWLLPAHLELGADVLTVLGQRPSFSLGITPNRPDLLSHRGVAREIAAATDQRIKTQGWRLSEKGRAATTMVRVVVEDASRCPRYVARIVSGVEVGPSPEWLRARLAAVGQRSLNNIVDITNYVLLELGQPLHAFDLNTLGQEGNLPTVRVRCAHAGEKLVTLDGVERDLSDDDLLIADASKALALAGVMGGADSEVTSGTSEILIESAYFDPQGIRRSARRHGLHTEASHRFERGVDPDLALRAADRCAQLIDQLGPGHVCKSHVEAAQDVPGSIEVQLRSGRVAQVLGVSVDAERVAQLLDPLQIKCVARHNDAMRFKVPTFRPDITREIDLIEEVARRLGFDEIPECLPSGVAELSLQPPERSAQELARDSLLSCGCTEVVTFGFGSPEEFAQHQARHGEPVRLLNALGETMSAMRTTLLPGLLRVAQHNQRQGVEDLRIFEIGKVVRRRLRTSEPSGSSDRRDAELPIETLRAAVLLAGGRYTGRWFEGGARTDFYDLSGVFEDLLEGFNLDRPPELIRAEVEHLHPHACAEVVLEGAPVGYLGQLHPQFLAGVDDLSGPVFVGEIDLQPLLAADTRQVEHRPLPRYPKTTRDVALLVDRDVDAAKIRAYLRDHAGGSLGQEIVENVNIFDVYRGDSLPPGKLSLAFAIDYRAADRTLTDEEVSPVFEALLGQLCQQFGAEIR